MIAKLIVWDENREKALQRLTKALSEYRINGVTTNIDFLYNVATSKPFVNEEIDTSFIEKYEREIFHSDEQALADELPMAALYLVLALAEKAKLKAFKTTDPYSPWNNTNAWRSNEAHNHQLVLAHNDIEYPVTVEQKRQSNRSYYLVSVAERTVDCQGRIDGDTLHVSIDGHRSQATIAHNTSSSSDQISLYRQNGVFNFVYIKPDCGNNDDNENHGGLVAPMNGTMVSVLVKAGDKVSKDQPLMIMEAMKMEHTIKAPENGTIDTLFYAEGDMVDGGSELLAFSPEEV
jgi:3-methylcrotonyl-CoA carboxylase alpha subunit